MKGADRKLAALLTRMSTRPKVCIVRLADQALDVVQLGDVRLHGEDLAVGLRLTLLAGGLQVVAIAAADRDLGTLPGQGDGRGLPDPAAPAGDEGDLVA